MSLSEEQGSFDGAYDSAFNSYWTANSDKSWTKKDLYRWWVTESVNLINNQIISEGITTSDERYAGLLERQRKLLTSANEVMSKVD